MQCDYDGEQSVSEEVWTLVRKSGGELITRVFLPEYSAVYYHRCGSLKALADGALCISALDPARYNWDEDPNWAIAVFEARRRGLTINKCHKAIFEWQQAISLKKSRTFQRWPVNQVCRHALDATMLRWNYDNPQLVAEVLARGLTTEACRQAIAIVTPRDEVALCRSSLDKSNSQWYSFHLQAEKRNLDTKKCQELLIR
jgi:hypothetical protein